jgi:hypothetical protein
MRVILVACAAGLSLALVACGGNASEPAAPSSTSPAAVAPASPSPVDQSAELEQAVRAFSGACLSGDAEASWKLLSEKSRDATSKDSWRAIVAAIAEQWGDAKLKSVKVVAIGEDAALVTYRYTDPAIDQVREPWVREAGAWRCDQ